MANAPGIAHQIVERLQRDVFSRGGHSRNVNMHELRSSAEVLWKRTNFDLYGKRIRTGYTNAKTIFITDCINSIQ